jgi:inhibitor of KinA
MSIVPLGDQAALLSFDNEMAALRFATAARRCAAPWLVDVVQAYATVAVFFDLAQIRFVAVVARLHEFEAHPGAPPAGKRHRIPCCYELQLDLERITAATQLSGEEIVRLHGSRDYTVYAIGFCPGFPYLGYLPEALCGVPRLPAPRLRLEAGSVGLTGRQTGIYTEPRPGGWNIVGRTPLQLVDVADGYFPLRTGDTIRFERIDRGEYERLLGERL